MRSFVYAFHGLCFAIKSQHNLLIHLSMVFLVVVVGMFFTLSQNEWIVVTLSIGLVISTEIINTAIEELVDMIHPNKHPNAGRIKDLAAGAVLVSAIAAAVAGLIIFVPKIIIWIGN